MLTYLFLVIQESLNANDLLRFQQIRQSVQNAISNAPSAAQASPARAGYNPSHTLPPPHLSQPLGAYRNGYPHTGIANGQRQAPPYGATMPLSLSFKPSPFYQIESSVGDVRTCEGKSKFWIA